MGKALQKYPDDDFEVPSGIHFAKICKKEGCRPKGYCDDLFDEAFIAGAEAIPDCPDN
jgi:hypothetical protein